MVVVERKRERERERERALQGLISMRDGHWCNMQACRVELWDTSGNPLFSSVNQAYYRGATCILLVFDLTDRASFDTIDTFMTAIRETARDGITIVLVGNKADLPQTRQVKRRCRVCIHGVLQLLSDDSAVECCV